MSTILECRVCQNKDGNKSFTATEMMFGMRDMFEYFECAKCGCVQIASIPADLSRYYPANYYSFRETSYEHKPWKIFLKKQLIRHHVYKEPTLVGKLFAYRFPKDEDFYPWVRRSELFFDGAVLDVGCGSGNVLLKLLKSGYTNLTGVDPFIEKDISYPGNVNIYKKELASVSGSYDLIIFNHVLEHMPDQAEALKHAFRLLKKGGCVLIRIPIAGTYAWRTYGTNWVQLDPPRHLYLHTVNSLKNLAAKLGFGRVEVEHDSTDFQFWGSEQYKKGIPLRDKRSYAELFDNSLFSAEQFKQWGELADQLNKKEDGDQASFYLFKD